jgi:type IV secretory pathway VirB4 component
MFSRVRSAERDAHRVTTANAQAIYPFVAESGLGGRGALIGIDLHGSAFTYDPFVLYEQRAISNPNLFVAGEVGSGKSSLVKTYLFRQAVFGRIPWVADPKGEYAPLARALGAEPIQLAPGGDVQLNPITRAAGWDGQLNLLRALAGGALERRLSPEEDAALREGLRALNAEPSEPVLPALVALLFKPTDAIAERLVTDRRELAERIRPVALGLQRLCEGDLRGMFDAPTTPGLRLDGPAVVLDLSRCSDSAALGLVMTCASAWQRAMIAKLHADAGDAPAAKVINVFDEAWRALAIPGVGEWLQASFKLSRRDGVQNVVVMHRLSDLAAAGAAGSRERELAEGLLHDASTRVIYRQVPDNVARTREVLGLSSVESELLPELDDGIGLWKVGSRSFLVQHRYSSIEAPLVDTDGAMLDKHREFEASERRNGGTRWSSGRGA